MASSMASAASSLLPGITSAVAAAPTTQARPAYVRFFHSKSGSSSARRLIVKAEEASSSAPPAPAAEKEATVAEAAKPPPIGPKRGTKVKILRKESYWYNGTGSVVTVDQVTKDALSCDEVI